MDRNEIIAKYEKGTHRLGRAVSLLTLIMLLSADHRHDAPRWL